MGRRRCSCICKYVNVYIIKDVKYFFRQQVNGINKGFAKSFNFARRVMIYGTYYKTGLISRNSYF